MATSRAPPTSLRNDDSWIHNQMEGKVIAESDNPKIDGESKVSPPLAPRADQKEILAQRLQAQKLENAERAKTQEANEVAQTSMKPRSPSSRSGTSSSSSASSSASSRKRRREIKNPTSVVPPGDIAGSYNPRQPGPSETRRSPAKKQRWRRSRDISPQQEAIVPRNTDFMQSHRY